ncbi:lipopolysaccharide export system protein LptA [Inhella inkyongensis]|uniref:Lipopolysaccharide export system protein LptA n=1 Tax=Inhella inkyongensis TaxID=392593 RepID=A0A840RYA3_9BURK|nr:lipopolysaccharide transport periplasmic protein LptA [Inhella inkyongensis]MBB5202935.1 lipopolysaccharide export system protein LptA [Inhella inkyongensis]
MSAPALLLLALAVFVALPGHAAKDDRHQPVSIESTASATLSSKTGRLEWAGPVLLVQGSLQLRAARLEAERRNDDTVLALASGEAGNPVRFSQALSRPGEQMEGSAERIEYDSRAETVRFLGAASVRTLANGKLVEELTGAAILYNARTEVLSVEPGAGSAQDKGKVRMVLMPRQSASAPAPAASGVNLQSSPALTPKPPTR